MKTLLSTIILLFAFSFVALAQTQTERDKGIELYKKGDFVGAVQILQEVTKQNKDDADAFYYLGWSLVQTQKLKEGRKAFEKASKLKPQDARPNVGLAYVALSSNKLNEAKNRIEKAIALNPNDIQAYYFLSSIQLRQRDYKSAKTTAEKAIAINPNFPNLYWIKVLATLGAAIGDKGLNTLLPSARANLYTEAMTTLKSFPNLETESEESRLVKDKISQLEMFARYFKESGQTNTPIPAAPLPTDPSVTPLRIISKPRAGYTDAARGNMITGVIRLAVLFSTDGIVEYVLPITGLGYGLNEEAVKAAYTIKFEPQKKNGKPVSVIKLIEYSFSIY